MSQELDSLVLFLQILIMKPISSWYQAVLVINKTILFSPWVKKNISHKVHIDIMNDWQIHVPADPPPKFSHRNFRPDLHWSQEQPWGLPNRRKSADRRNSHMPDIYIYLYIYIYYIYIHIYMIYTYIYIYKYIYI